MLISASVDHWSNRSHAMHEMRGKHQQRSPAGTPPGMLHQRRYNIDVGLDISRLRGLSALKTNQLHDNVTSDSHQSRRTTLIALEIDIDAAVLASGRTGRCVVRPNDFVGGRWLFTIIRRAIWPPTFITWLSQLAVMSGRKDPDGSKNRKRHVSKDQYLSPKTPYALCTPDL